MQIAVFSTKPYDRQFLDAANAAAGRRRRLTCLEARLARETAVLAHGAGAVCAFVNDMADAAALDELHERACGSSRCARQGSTTGTSRPRGASA